MPDTRPPLSDMRVTFSFTGAQIHAYMQDALKQLGDIAALESEVERLRKALEAAKISHGVRCDRIEYPGSSNCDCGAMAHNAAIDAALGESK